jgi:DNA invertase Pin-like site-specific DNA recombinase
VAALEAACRAKAVLVVYSLSRMSRSVTDTLAIVARLDKAGAGFVSLTESIDTTTADGAPRRDSQ